MNMIFIKTIKIRSYEAAFYFRDREFKALLREGRAGSSTRSPRSRSMSCRCANRSSSTTSSTWSSARVR